MDDLFNSLFGHIKNVKIPKDYSRYCVYFVECNGVFKIGTTSDIKSRLNSLQTSNPTPINLVYTISVPLMGNHRDVEKALHIIFENNYVRGEWYKITEQDIERIKLLSIDDILNIAEKMRTIKEKDLPNKPEKPKNQMAFDFFDDDNL